MYILAGKCWLVSSMDGFETVDVSYLNIRTRQKDFLEGRFYRTQLMSDQ